MLEQLAAELNADPARPVLGVVRLNGVVHAEERAAFRNIARQLCLCGRCPRRSQWEPTCCTAVKALHVNEVTLGVMPRLQRQEQGG